MIKVIDQKANMYRNDYKERCYLSINLLFLRERGQHSLNVSYSYDSTIHLYLNC